MAPQSYTNGWMSCIHLRYFYGPHYYSIWAPHNLEWIYPHDTHVSIIIPIFRWKLRPRERVKRLVHKKSVAELRIEPVSPKCQVGALATGQSFLMDMQRRKEECSHWWVGLSDKDLHRLLWIRLYKTIGASPQNQQTPLEQRFLTLLMSRSLCFRLVNGDKVQPGLLKKIKKIFN